MDETQIRKWATTREMGRTKYVLLYGVIGWGVPTAVMFSIVIAALQGWNRFWLVLVVSLVLFPLGGTAFGILTWNANESAYQKSLKT